MIDITKDQLEKVISNHLTYAPVLKELGIYDNGTSRRWIKKQIEIHDIDISHFDNKKHLSKIHRKYNRVKKECPVCSKVFEIQEGHPRAKVTCSHACSNTYFRSGENNPNWKPAESQSDSRVHRAVCFLHHEKRCIVCGEEKIVAVHHYDENKNNNSPENLIPMCPTHHQYVHSRYSDEVMPIVEEYRNRFISEQVK
jgi:hypothetical protein